MTNTNEQTSSREVKTANGQIWSHLVRLESLGYSEVDCRIREAILAYQHNEAKRRGVPLATIQRESQ